MVIEAMFRIGCRRVWFSGYFLWVIFGVVKKSQNERRRSCTPSVLRNRAILPRFLMYICHCQFAPSPPRSVGCVYGGKLNKMKKL